MQLRSARLRLDPIGIEQLDAVHALWCEPGVRRYLWDDQIIAPSRAAEPLMASDNDFRESRFGLWGLYLPESFALIGFCGLRNGDLVPEPELLYGLTEDYWHRGFATESAETVLAFAFEELGLPAVAAATDVPNVRSVQVLQRLGMRWTHSANHNGLETVFFRVTRSEWVARLGSPSDPRPE